MTIVGRPSSPRLAVFDVAGAGRGDAENPAALEKSALREFYRRSAPACDGYSSPDSSAALPPAAAVLIVTVCSVAKRAR